jgi:precorrin-6B methylase 2
MELKPNGTQPDPSAILQVGLGFWASKTLLAAVKLGLFTLLGEKPLRAEEIRLRLDLHPRSLYDFLDALVALGFLHREGMKESAVYSNTEATALFLDRNNTAYLGGLLEMANDRLYRFWDNLEEGLRTGKPQNESKDTEKQLFDGFYEDKDRMRQFMEAMAGLQLGTFATFAKKFNFNGHRTLCDMGGATGALSIQVALAHPAIRCISFDLPDVEPVAREWINRFQLADRISIRSGDFFKDDFPKADIITMGNILHDWGYNDKLHLMQSAYKALPEGGAFVAIENIIDNGRRENAFGLLMSLNMLIETQEGYDFTFHDFREMASKAGFKLFECIPLTGPASAAIAFK